MEIYMCHSDEASLTVAQYRRATIALNACNGGAKR